MLIEDLHRKPYYEYLNDIVKDMVDGTITLNEILFNEIKEWKSSATRANMISGEKYYLNETDIRKNKSQDVDWKSNTKLEHGFTKKLVDQKIGYLLSKDPTIGTENEKYRKRLETVFNRKMLKSLKNIGKEAINKGIAYLYVYIDEQGALSFRKFPSEQIIPFWKDPEHTELTAFIRIYTESIYMNGKKEAIEKVEYHHSEGISYFVLDGLNLIPDVPAGVEKYHHFLIGDKPFLWNRIPLIPFKYNEEEQPLIQSIKSLIDNYNMQASVNADLLADIPKFIYKLINYGGEDLKEFLADLNRYKAVRLDAEGDVDKLQADPQTDATEKELDRDRKSIYEFGRGVDTTDDTLGNATGVALRYRYSDLDMDCNILESEFQASIEHLLWFVNEYFFITKQGDFRKETVNFIFNRDIIINESEVITDAKNSVGILDDKTIRENHPWYTEDVEKRLEEQKKKQEDDYKNAFPQQKTGGRVDGQE